jgi:hypothetical protein
MESFGSPFPGYNIASFAICFVFVVSSGVVWEQQVSE